MGSLFIEGIGGNAHGHVGTQMDADRILQGVVQSGDGFTFGAGLAKITPGGADVLLRFWKES